MLVEYVVERTEMKDKINTMRSISETVLLSVAYGGTSYLICKYM